MSVLSPQGGASVGRRGGSAAIKRQLKTGGQMEAFAHDQFIRLLRSKKQKKEKKYIDLKENA